MTRRVIGLMAVGMVLAFLGCADDGGEGENTAVPAECGICEPGTTVCLGAYSIICNSDGTELTSVSCLQGQACDPSEGICVLSYCPEYGFRGCADEATVSRCIDGGLVDEPCGSGEVCKAGSCISESLDGSACGYQAIVTGTGGDLAVSDCAAGEACTVVEGEATCGAKVCVPGTRTCQDRDGDGFNELAQVCNTDGTGAETESEVDCSLLGGTCVDGFCSCAEPTAAGGEDLEDVVDDLNLDGGPSIDISLGFSDTLVQGDVPELQAPNKAEGWIGGSKISFQSFAKVSFEAANSRLVISFANGQKKVEISIGEATETWTGTATEANNGFIGYNDGSGVGQDFKWGAGTSPLGNPYEGTLEVVVEENGGPGSRVKGTFSGDLVVAPGEDGVPLGITDGTFDIQYE